jgi:hypothetical protein
MTALAKAAAMAVAMAVFRVFRAVSLMVVFRAVSLVAVATRFLSLSLRCFSFSIAQFTHFSMFSCISRIAEVWDVGADQWDEVCTNAIIWH